MDFLNILGKTEIHAILKTWVKWTSIVLEKYKKAHTFQIYGFLK